MAVRSSGRRTRLHALGRPITYRVSDLPRRDSRCMGTNTLVIRATSLVDITTIAIQIALGGIVRCKDCFAEGVLDECLIDDKTESSVVRE